MLVISQAARASQACASLCEYIRRLPGVTLQEETQSYLHAVFLTPLLGFADDVEFRLDEHAKAIQIRSASRVGRSDLGANRARLERIRERWTPPLPGAGD